MSNYVFVNRPFDASTTFDVEILNKKILDFVVDNSLAVEHVYDGASPMALDNLVDRLRHGDTVYTWTWRCLITSNTNIPLLVLSIINRIRQKGAELCCVQENIDTASPNDRLTLTQLAAFEQFNIDVSEYDIESPRKRPNHQSPRIFESIAIFQYTGC